MDKNRSSLHLDSRFFFLCPLQHKRKASTELHSDHARSAAQWKNVLPQVLYLPHIRPPLPVHALRDQALAVSAPPQLSTVSCQLSASFGERRTPNGQRRTVAARPPVPPVRPIALANEECQNWHRTTRPLVWRPLPGAKRRETKPLPSVSKGGERTSGSEKGSRRDPVGGRS
jgi:hypothetical protein